MSQIEVKINELKNPVWEKLQMENIMRNSDSYDPEFILKHAQITELKSNYDKLEEEKTKWTNELFALNKGDYL